MHNGGEITLVGTFTSAPNSPITSGKGSITGTLADNALPATYTYNVGVGSEIILSKLH